MNKFFKKELRGFSDHVMIPRLLIPFKLEKESNPWLAKKLTAAILGLDWCKHQSQRFLSVQIFKSKRIRLARPTK